MSPIESLLSTKRPFLTDGGLETSLIFKEGIDIPSFAALTLLREASSRAAMERYFDRFLHEAAQAHSGFVLDTCTWRGCVSWTEELGLSKEDLLDLSELAVGFAQTLKHRWSSQVSPIVINGVVGPAGDGYAPDQELTAAQATVLHAPQVSVLAAAGVDVVSAITMTHIGEAIGIVQAAETAGVPVVVSFTVETDGRLPTGQTLQDAIEETDYVTGHVPLYYMVNCAHPDHFGPAFKAGEDWLGRIGGVRANASRMSHAELDAAETLDEGDPLEFGALHSELADRLPNLRVVGGCCGTDHRHVACVSMHLHKDTPENAGISLDKAS